MTDRLRAIVEAMKVRPGDRILEIGCGHGVAASYICERLSSGHLVAIDRSRKMIAAAAARNKAAIASGTAEFHVADFLSYDPGRQRFDKILAVRVRAFHVDADHARSIVLPWLAPRGKLFAVYDEPGSTPAAGGARARGVGTARRRS
jgi:cyclopropane fatty-acyl-phospholipid synthase-like methyltransferase